MLLSNLLIVGCAGAPVQEMSNARQAIRAARDAGADRVAPQQLSEAQDLLQRAEASLQNRAYGEARRSAIAARGKAAEALEAAKPNGAG
jgi:sialic acid synthase SpsE